MLLGKTKAFLAYCFSFVFPLKQETFKSDINGILEVWYLNGRLVLNAKDVNYSYDSLHKIFQKLFKKIHLKATSSDKVLLLGLGGGSVVSILQKELKLNCRTKAVEIDPVIIKIAKKYFGIDHYSNLEILLCDAWDYVKEGKTKYELIIVDIFINSEVPEKFLTKNFVENLQSITSKDGMVLFNLIVATEIQRKESKELFHLFESLGGSVSSIALMESNCAIVWINS